jgi:hypothetical protein
VLVLVLRVGDRRRDGEVPVTDVMIFKQFILIIN